MAIYQVKVLRRTAGAPAVEQCELSTIIEADDQQGAMNEAYRRAQALAFATPQSRRDGGSPT